MSDDLKNDVILAIALLKSEHDWKLNRNSKSKELAHYVCCLTGLEYMLILDALERVLEESGNESS